MGRVCVGVGVGVARLARAAHEQQHFLRTAHGRAGGGRLAEREFLEGSPGKGRGASLEGDPAATCLRRALLVEGAGPAQQQRADDGQDDRGDARLLKRLSLGDLSLISRWSLGDAWLLQRLRRRLVVAGRSLGEAGPEDRHGRVIRGRVILAALARAYQEGSEKGPRRVREGSEKEAAGSTGGRGPGGASEACVALLLPLSSRRNELGRRSCLAVPLR